MLRGCDEMGEEYVFTRVDQARSFAKCRKWLEREVLSEVYMKFEDRSQLNQHDAEGERHGDWVGQYGNAVPHVFRTYVHGKLYGLFVTWYSNGRAEKYETYDNGEQNGQHVEWYDDGQLKHICTRANGKTHGISVNWHPQGELQECSTYEHGEENGLMCGWHRNGNLYIRCTFEHGKKCGLYEGWDKYGNKGKSDMYIEGVYQHPIKLWVVSGASWAYSSIQSAFSHIACATIDPAEPEGMAELVQSE